MTTADKLVKAIGTFETQSMIRKGEELIEQARDIHQEIDSAWVCRNPECGICKIRRGMQIVVDEFKKIDELKETGSE